MCTLIRPALLLLCLLLAGCSGGQAVAPLGPRYGTQISKTASSYVVQRGDTLYSIAWRLNIDYRSLASRNSIRSPYTIYPGQRLNIRGTPAQPVTNTPTPRTTQATASNRPSKPTPQASTGARVSQWLWPATGPLREQFSSATGGNKGIDIGGRRGAKVSAAAAGQVVYAGSGLRQYGNLIIIKHNQTHLSAYAHNDSLLVSEGDQVKQGQQIARMGSSGTDQVKLHFEIRRHGTTINPLPLLPKRP